MQIHGVVQLRRVVLVIAAVLLHGATAFPAACVAQEPEPSAAEAPPWREALEYLASDGSYWWTSNAEHAGEGAEAPAYGTAWVPGVGGTSIRGCLFSESEDGTTMLQWEFFHAWDPAEQALYGWQTTEAGGVGAGHGTAVRVGETSVMEQTFAWPNGVRERIRHEADHVHRDTMVTRSFNWTDGEWRPRRSYTWIRRAGDPREKCPNLGAR